MAEVIHPPTERVKITMDANRRESRIDSDYIEIDCRHWQEITSTINPPTPNEEN